MATFEELFPDAAANQRPFEPIQPRRVQSELQQINSRTRALGATPGGDDQFMSVFSEMLDAPVQQPEGSTQWRDYGRKFIADIGGLGAAAAGTGEYFARKVAGEGNTPLEQGAADLASVFARGRHASTQFQEDWTQRMTPEARDRAMRQILTLDPNHTIWQGGPGEVLSSIALKMAGAAPSTAVTLLPGTLMLRAGLGPGAITYLGAAEAGLSLGSIAANIAQEIEQAPEQELMQSQRYAQLRQTMSEAQARQVLIGEAQGYAPIVGGIVVGAISAAAGRYLEPVLVRPGGALSRMWRGTASESLQESGQSGAEQVAQNYAAQLYDADRSLGEGVPEAMAQGVVVGGPMGGVTMALVGPRKRALTPPPKDTDLTPIVDPEAPEAPAPAGGATFESVFGTGGETAPAPRMDATGQILMDFGEVDVDRQAALNARRDKLIADMFEQEGMTPQQEQAAYLQNPWPVSQLEMDLPQATRDIVPAPAPEPRQLELGLRMRAAGMPPQPLPPGGQLPADTGPDLSAPAGYSMERLPGREPVVETDLQAKGKKAAAVRMLRQQAAVQNPLAAQDAERAEMYRGMVLDDTQIDAFAEPVVGPDQPSAEPLGDLLAQLRDLADQEHPREAVFLSADSIRNLQANGTYEQVRGVGVPLANFDGRGGVLIAKNRAVAEEMLALRDTGAASMQEIIGLATGAGRGGAPGADIAVQQRDAEGNVVRESRVATPEEADRLAETFDTGDREGVIVSAAQALKRRNQRLAIEQAEAERAKKARAVRERGEAALREEFPDPNDLTADRGVKKIGRDTVSEEEAAGKLIRYAGRLRARDDKKGLAGEAHPSTLQFANEKDASEYERLFNELQGALINEDQEAAAARAGKSTAAAYEAAKARTRSVRRQMATHRRLTKPTTTPERILKAAQKAYPQGYAKAQRKIRREARSTAARPEAEPIVDELKAATRESLDGMTATELNTLFMEAATQVARRRSPDAKTGRQPTAESIAAKYPSRSEKMKLILRVGRLLRLQDARVGGARTRTLPITAAVTVAKSATGDALLSRKQGRGRRPRRAGTFGLDYVFDPEMPREMTPEARAKHKARLDAAYTQLAETVRRLEYSKTGVFMRQLALVARRHEALQLPINPQDMTPAQRKQAQEVMDARVAIKFARAYLRNLTRYGELLLRLKPKSVAGVKEVERFNRAMGKLLDAKDVSFLTQLHDMATVENQVQAELAAAVDPKKLGFLRSRKRRVAMALRANRKLLESINTLRNIREKWKTNFLFVQYVEPVMHKLIGYMTRDDSFYSTAERRASSALPTVEEMNQVRAVLKRFRGSATARKNLFGPLKQWFMDMGFEFDGHDLKVPDMSVDGSPLRYNRQRYGYRYDVPASERTAYADRQKQQRAAAAALRNERIRRARLTPAQRAREDFNLARKIERHMERERRKGMTYEQRRLAEALDRRGVRLKLELLNPTVNMPMVRKATVAMAGRLEAAIGTYDAPKLNDLLGDLQTHLPDQHPLRPLVDRLRALNMNVSVMWAKAEKPIDGYGEYSADRDGYQLILMNREKLDDLRAKGEDPAPHFIHTLLHEAVHAATVGELKTNVPLRTAMVSIMRQMRIAAKEQGVSLKFGNKEFYAIRDNNVFEFVAEAFTNDVFQEQLRQIRINPTRSVWGHIIELVRKLLGMEPKAENVLDLVLSTADSLFTGRVESTAGVSAIVKYGLEDVPTRGVVGEFTDRVLQSVRISDDLRNRVKDFKRAVTHDAPRGLLPAMTMEQIRDFYSNSFGGASGPLASYMRAFFRRNAEVSRLMESADTLSRRWTALNEKDAEKSLEMSRIMSEATQFGIHPDRGIDAEGNEHLTTPKQKQHHAELAKRFNALPPEWRRLYDDVRQYYRESLEREAALVTLNAIRAGLGEDKDFPYTEADVKRLKLDTLEGLEKTFGDGLTEEARSTIVALARIPHLHVGPYFPLSRYGDYVVTAAREVERKTFPDGKSAREWMKERRADDPTLSVSLGKQADDRYEVRVVEREVRMVETRTEADMAREEMVARYGAANVSQPQLKAQAITSGAAIKTGRGLQTILNNLEGNKAAQNAIKEFYLRSLSDRSFRKHEIKRQNRRGVDYDLQHRAFGSYAKSASYYSAQLQYGWQMADALAKMQSFSEAVAEGDAHSNLSAIELAKVTREIAVRDQMMATQAEPSKLVRAGTALSQFMLLTSPSYWLINATQPYMVTLPWLAARYGTAEATAALARAQGMIAHPILSQMGESWFGLKALKSKIAAEKAFTVLEQVEGYIKERGGDRADEYLDMLAKLKRESIIDLSFVSELRDIAEGANAGLKQRVLDASRIMSHLTEVNNRIMTALAAYDLARDRGFNVEAAQSAAHQAVSLTQFNLSSGNAPRLFSYRGPLGQAGPLVFQFMKYPQHIYALLIDNFRRLVAADRMERSVARKTLLGLGLTHMAAGGVVGVMLQPIKWAVGLIMSAFGDEDEPYTVANALSGETFDRLVREYAAELFGTDIGRILSGGLPHAIGVDLSDRMSLGSLYFVDLKTDTAESTIGSLVTSFGGPLFSIGANAARGIQYLQEGDFAKAIESVSPKGLKDVVKALRYSNEGLTNMRGEEIMDASRLHPGALFAQSLGFTPSSVSEHYAKANVVKETQLAAEERRKQLITRYLRAEAGERADIMRDIREFNRRKPASAITMSQILRAAARRKERELRMQRYGVDLRGDDVLYASAGDPYQ